MIISGTLLNVVAITLGGIIGIFLGAKLSEKLRDTIIAGLGIFVCLLGVKMFIGTQNSIIPLSGLVIGTVIGELLHIEEGLESLGDKFEIWSEKKFGETRSGGKDRFLKGFMTASLLFIIGPVAILGCIQNGIDHDITLLTVKSILDGISSIAFASTMGIGVIFSILPLFIYQALLSILAVQAKGFLTESMMTEMSAVGGIMLVGVGLSNLLNIKKIRVSSMVPALFVVPLIVWIMGLFKGI